MTAKMKFLLGDVRCYCVLVTTMSPLVISRCLQWDPTVSSILSLSPWNLMYCSGPTGLTTPSLLLTSWMVATSLPCTTTSSSVQMQFKLSRQTDRLPVSGSCWLVFESCFVCEPTCTANNLVSWPVLLLRYVHVFKNGLHFYLQKPFLFLCCIFATNEAVILTKLQKT